MPEQRIKICMNCEFFEKTEAQSWFNWFHECHFYPPNRRNDFLPVKSGDWCGQWRAKEKSGVNLNNPVLPGQFDGQALRDLAKMAGPAISKRRNY